MRRIPLRAGRGALAVAIVLGSLGAAPAAAASVLPSPSLTALPGSLPVPTPTPTVLPVALPLPTPAPGSPIDPAPVLVAAPPLPATGAGGGTRGSSALPQPTSAPYQPSPDEQQSLPNEPGRIAYEQQQQDVSNFNAQMQDELGATAIAAGGGSGRFGWPVVIPKGQRIPITQRFGCTDVPGEPYKSDCPSKRWHTGIDVGMPLGTPVFAADAGIARIFRTGTGYGNYVMIIHGNGWATLYGHLSAFAVQDGQVVQKGDQVGFVGSTGFSTGPHLHFEIRFDRDYVDPCAELKC